MSAIDAQVAMNATAFNDPTAHGPNTMLLGASGTGKTHACRTLHAALRAIDSSAQVLTLFTEPRWQPIAHIKCSEGMHIRYIQPSPTSWDSMIERSKNLTKMPWEANLKIGDKHKNTYTAFVRLVESVAKYTCDRCGQDFGDVTELPPTHGFWLDSLSGINRMAMQMVVGSAVAKSQPQWGAAMDSELGLINELCYETKCHFVLVCHVQKLLDEINGGFTLQVLALGNKNAPEFPKNFDDVVECQRLGDKFSWSNASGNVDTKPSWLPIAKDLKPDFAQIVQAWHKARGVATP